MLDVTINDGCERNVMVIGDEKTPVLTIDQLLTSTTQLVEYATDTVEFSSDNEFVYPGIRAPLPTEYVEELAPQLISLIAHEFNVPRSYKPRLIHQLYSLVTLQPGELQPLQRIPHFDNRSPYYFATVNYLSDAPHAGTGFFRHRPTGFERISDDRFEAYKAATMEHMQLNGEPRHEYISASNDLYELIGQVDHALNKIAIYPGNLLHSGLINPDVDIDDNPGTGRLTANLFFYFTPG